MFTHQDHVNCHEKNAEIALIHLLSGKDSLISLQRGLVVVNFRGYEREYDCFSDALTGTQAVLDFYRFYN